MSTGADPRIPGQVDVLSALDRYARPVALTAVAAILMVLGIAVGAAVFRPHQVVIGPQGFDDAPAGTDVSSRLRFLEQRTTRHDEELRVIMDRLRRGRIGEIKDLPPEK